MSIRQLSLSVLCGFLLHLPVDAAAQVFINEFMAINDSTITDEDGAYSDWVELFNAGSTTVNLDGWYLTDNANDLTKWRFPATFLEPNEFLLVFASGKNRSVSGQELHTSFRLDGDGEYLALVDANTNIVQSYEFPEQFRDQSYGLGAESIITADHAVRVLVPSDGSLGSTWTGGDEPFDDTAWVAATNGVGFQTGVASSLAHQEANLVTYWDFDSKTGNVVEDRVAGSTHDGVLSNGADITAGNQGYGGSGEALAPNADGSGATRGHLSAMDPTTYDFNSSFTWHARIKTGTGTGGILSRAPKTLNWNQGSKAVFLRANTVQFDTGWVGNPQTGVSVVDNQWHQVVVTFNAATDLLRVYVDPATANPVAQYNSTHDVNRYDEHNHSHNGGVADTDFRVGWVSPNFEANEFNGLIDDAAVWSSEFSPADVALLAQDEPFQGSGPYGNALNTEIPMGSVSVYIRLPFNVTDPSRYELLTLRMKYDDAFVAYLNGVEVAADNAPAMSAFDASALADRDPAEGLVPVNFDLTPQVGALQAGNNILTVHGLNASSTNSEMLVAAELVGLDLDAGSAYLAVPTPGGNNADALLPPAGEVIISPGSATFTGTIQVTMETAFPNGSIVYTTDGSLPTQASQPYLGTLNLSASTHIRARVYAPGFAGGAIASGAFIRLAETSNLAGIEAPSAFSSDLPLVILDNFGDGGLNGSTFKTLRMLIFEPQQGTGRTTLGQVPAQSLRAAFRVRGASTAGLPKKQYRVEVRDERDEDFDVSLLGLPAESDWVLAGPYVDEALIRNRLVFGLGREMGLEASRSSYCEVFLNTGGGDLRSTDYIGVYYFVENIKAGPNRVDIARLDPSDITEPNVSGGYIIRHEAGASEGPRLNGWNHLEVHDPDDLTQPQLDWISGFINDFDQVLRAPNMADPLTGYPSYIDVPSFINTIVINELAREQDDYVRSAYLHKDRNGKLINGPLWDFNLSFGISCCFESHVTDDNATFGGWQYNHTYNRGARENGVGDNTSNPTLNRFDWYTILLSDPDFMQLFIDRYQELRRGLLSTEAFNARIDALAAEVDEAQARNFTKWPTLGVRTTGFQRTEFIYPTWQEHVDHIKDWALARVTWMDSQFLPSPEFNSTGGPVFPGFEVVISASAGTIYYTLDGQDPRMPGGGISPDAIQYTGAIAVNETIRVFARAHDGGNWSGARVATFIIDTPELVITEIMYHPQDPPPGILTTNIDEDFEFIELRNVGATPLQLDGVSLSGGVQFTFPAQVLASGERVLVVNNVPAFLSRYGAGHPVAGEYTGNLNNTGERILLDGRLKEPILDFQYDEGWYPITDGFGFSLVIVDDTAPPSTWGLKSSWRPSGTLNGTPGGADPGLPDFPPVLISEALAHSDPSALDFIELFNPGAAAANVGGWFLTDDFRQPRKYRIPDGTMIPAGGYLSFDEAQFNTGNFFGVAFALSSLGDEVFLFSGDVLAELTGYFHGHRFGASETGVSFGRHVISTGVEHFVAQTAVTRDAANAPLLVGPVVISEVMYRPPDIPGEAFPINNQVDEYVELHNITASPVDLFDPANPSNTWSIDGGIDFAFATSTTIPANGYMVLVSFDPVADPIQLNAFRATYGIDASVTVAGPYHRQLDNAGERVSLLKPDSPVALPGPDFGVVPMVLVDEVNYRDSTPWPAAADGIGLSLQRVAVAAYGDDPANWGVGMASPGSAFVAGTPPVITTQPADQIVVAGQSATFSVAANGSGAIQFQWRFNAANLPGETGASLQLDNVQPSQAGEYEVIVYNEGSATVSDTVTLSVLIPAAITRQPEPLTVRPGTNVTLTVLAMSSSPISYQWYKDGSLIPGATSASLSFLGVQGSDDGSYQVEVIDDIGSVFSDVVRLTVLVNPFVIVPPVSMTVVEGEPVTLSIQVGGTLPMSYRWRRSFFTLKQETIFSDKSFHHIPSVQMADAGLYTVVLTNQAFSTPGVLSPAGMLTVLAESDGDGMPDEWEAAYGLNPDDPGDAGLDGDNDQFTNLEEYRSGTLPNDPSSFLRIESIDANGGVRVTFIAASNKTYSLEFKPSLDTPAWTRLEDVVAHPTNRTVVLMDSIDDPERFYRLVTPRQE